MEKMNIKLSGETLGKIAHATETAENVSLALAVRDRVRDFSNINTLKYELRSQGLKIVDADYNKYWSSWQDAGLGVISLGRGKKQTKFLHYYDMRVVARAGLDRKDIVVAAAQKDNESEIKKVRSAQLDDIASSIGKKQVKAAATPAKDVGAQNVFIALRKGVFIALKLPLDITDAEVSVIKEALDRLTVSATKVA